jgi:hypothetical protein
VSWLGTRRRRLALALLVLLLAVRIALPPILRSVLVSQANAALAGRAARAEELRTVLGKDYGVDAARVAIGEPEVDREHGRAAVGVALAAGS